MKYDAVILGGGPAAVSAALTLRARGKTAAILSGGIDDIPLSRASRITNYPGCPDISGRAPRRTFFGVVPRTPRQMYTHVNETTAYYAAAFGIALENLPELYVNRMQALAELEQLPDFLSGKVYTAPDGELWTLRKGLRRFLWHDRIHARAMWRTAAALWGKQVENPFFFV